MADAGKNILRTRVRMAHGIGDWEYQVVEDTGMDQALWVEELVDKHRSRYADSDKFRALDWEVVTVSHIPVDVLRIMVAHEERELVSHKWKLAVLQGQPGANGCQPKSGPELKAVSRDIITLLIVEHGCTPADAALVLASLQETLGETMSKVAGRN